MESSRLVWSRGEDGRSSGSEVTVAACETTATAEEELPLLHRMNRSLAGFCYWGLDT